MALTEEVIFAATLDANKFNRAAAKMRNSAEQAGAAATNAGQKFSQAATKTQSMSKATVGLGAKLKNFEPVVGRAASGMSGMAGAMGGAVGQTNALGGAVAGVAGAFAGGGLLAVGIAGVTLGLGLLWESLGKANEEADKAYTVWVLGYSESLKKAQVETDKMGQAAKALEDRIGELTMGVFEYRRQLVIGAKMQLQLEKDAISNFAERERELEKIEGVIAKRRERAAKIQVAADASDIRGMTVKRKFLSKLTEDEKEYLGVTEDQLKVLKFDLQGQANMAKEFDRQIGLKDHMLGLMDKEQRLLKKKEATQGKILKQEKAAAAAKVKVSKIEVEDLDERFDRFEEDLEKHLARKTKLREQEELKAAAALSARLEKQHQEELRLEKEKNEKLKAEQEKANNEKLAALRLYSGEATGIMNGAFTASLDVLERAIAGEKMMLHEMLILWATSTMKQAGIRIFGSGLATFIDGVLMNSVVPGSGAAALKEGTIAMGIGAGLGAGGAVGGGMATRMGIGVSGAGGAGATPTQGVNAGGIGGSGPRGDAAASGETRNVYVFNAPVYGDQTSTAKDQARLQRIARDDLLERG